MADVRINVPIVGMECGTCASTVEQRLASVPGVVQANVNFTTGTAKVVLPAGKVEASELAYRDLYSCFPSAVQVAAREIGLDPKQPLTVTGGLTFGGGPMNNYVMHGVARMAELLRKDPGAKGLCTANGGYLTKHAFGVYSTARPARSYEHADLQPEVDATPRREAVVDAEGPVNVESYTVMYEDGEPVVGHAACLLPDGRRTWANVVDREAAAEMTLSEFCGRRGRLHAGGILELAG